MRNLDGVGGGIAKPGRCGQASRLLPTLTPINHVLVDEAPREELARRTVS